MMGLIDRILQVIRANFNSMLTKAEDPEKILEQTVMEMQEKLVEMRQAVATSIANQKRTERQLAQAQSNADEWYRRTQLAIQQGNDVLAREALTKRRTYQEAVSNFSSQIEQQSILVVRLKRDLQGLEVKISEARTKKDMYIARARSAEASLKLQDMLGAVNGTGSQSAFDRMEEKVMQLEAKTEVMTELSGDNLQKQFDALDSANDLDAELAAMKAQMLNGTENTTPSLQQLPKSLDS
jgi:phage shock protein A